MQDELEDAATVLMSGPAAEEMLGDLRELYRRTVTEEEDFRESESEVAAFRLVAEDESLPIAVGTLQPEPPAAAPQPWLLLAGAVAVGALVIGAMQAF